MPKIESVDVRPYVIPLPEPMGDAKHGTHTPFDLIAVVLKTSDGLEGAGYTYTGGIGGRAVAAVLEHDLKPVLLGADSRDVEALHEALYWHTHYVGRGGVAGFAISAVDIALWDLRGKREGLPLWKMAGGAGQETRVYAGAIDLNFTRERLVENFKGYVAAGFEAVKIKVGRPDLQDDRERVAAVREAIGPDRKLMVDANYGLSREQAAAAAEAFAPYDILWFEEPIDPEDLPGYAMLAETTPIPLAQGENLHNLDEFRRAIAGAGLSYIQPDASNCGGVTGWLKVAAMADAAGIPVCSHGMQELHVGLMAGVAHAGWMEAHSFPIIDYTTRPLVLKNARAVAGDAPGTGVEFDWAKLAPHRVSG